MCAHIYCIYKYIKVIWDAELENFHMEHGKTLLFLLLCLLLLVVGITVTVKERRGEERRGEREKGDCGVGVEVGLVLVCVRGRKRVLAGCS